MMASKQTERRANHMWKRVPWVNLWMMVFGGAGIWIIADVSFGQEFIYRSSGPTVLTALVILGVVGLVGFVRLPLSFFYESDKPTIITLNDLVGVYLSAWKQLRRRKWMLWVFGLVGAIGMLGGLGVVQLTRHYLVPLQLI